MTDKEMFALVNQVNGRVARGDAESIAALKALPKDYAVSALLNIFEQNYHLYLEKPENRRIALKVGEVLAEIPGTEEYLLNLLKKLPQPTPRWLFQQRQNAIDCLVNVHNKTSVRVFCSSLGESDLGIEPGVLGKALAAMNIPSAPYGPKGAKESSSPQGIAEWKDWWEANKEKYAE